jgi:hypothetical protein
MGSLELAEHLNQGVGLHYPPAVTQRHVRLSTYLSWQMIVALALYHVLSLATPLAHCRPQR